MPTSARALSTTSTRLLAALAGVQPLMASSTRPKNRMAHMRVLRLVFCSLVRELKPSTMPCLSQVYPSGMMMRRPTQLASV